MMQQNQGLSALQARAGTHPNRSRWYWLLQGLYLLLLVPIGSAWAQDAGQVISLLGSAEVWREGRWQPIADGAVLAAGEVLRTGEGSRVAVLLSNGTQLKLNANSRLELKQVAPAPEGFIATTSEVLRSVLRVLSGEIWVRSSGQPLDIQTVPATATIRGTEFNLAVAPDASARLAVLNGLVEFSNPQGSVLVAADEQADVRLGEAPRKTVLLNPLDAVQWSLYYPDPTGGAPVAAVTDPQAQGYWTGVACRELLAGRIPAAEQAIDRALALNVRDADAYSLRTSIALVQNRNAAALASAERAVEVDPHSAAAYLSLSLARQAGFDLDAALAAAQKAVALQPDNVRARVQESSLLLSMGRLRAAVKAAQQARQYAPDDAMVNTVWGFVQLANHRVDEARTAFQNAIGQDSTLGLPQLGLGLALFRHNQDAAALEAMRKATLLEPRVALYNSYLGKAFYEIKDDPRAAKYLDIAKQLDPHDPTPYLYDAIRLQSINRPVQAVESLQKSIELNNDRAVYRSRLLLDEDLATRSATLGRIYNEVGFTELGLREGWQSVNRDPANYSAHRLLADSYMALPNREPARVSELLQSQLLQPINMNPIQPQMAETKLMLAQGGPLTPSLYEFNPLFVQDRATLLASALGGSLDTWADNLVLSGLTDRWSYSVGQFHYQSNGYRENNDLEHDIYNLFAQFAVTADFSLQAEYRRRDTANGDLVSSFDGSFRAFQQQDFSQETARVGARYSLSPHTDLIASVIYKDQSDVLTYTRINESIGARDKGTQAEAQMLYRADQFNIIAGLGAYSFDNEFVGFVQPDTNSSQQNIYGYANINLPERVIWTVGLGYESTDDPSAKLNEFNPKLGVQWAINDFLSLRAAAFKTVKRANSVEQTIEPTQIAGFNQLNDYFNMTVSKNYGVGLDVRFSKTLFGGLEALSQDNDVPFGTLDVPEFYEIQKNHNNFYSAYLYWMPSREWALSAKWLYEDFEIQEGLLTEIFMGTPHQLRTLTVPLSVQYFDPSGFFAGLGVAYVNQRIQYLDLSSFTPLPAESENFTVVNAGLGYRLPKRLGLVAFEVRNLFDREFNFQDNSFQTGVGQRGANPLYIPERTFFGRVTLNF